jgi:SAM-dependent methyltransferase
MDSTPRLLANVREYYEASLAQFGRTAKGVDWNSEGSQYQRFSELIRLLDVDQPFSVLDFGCGYAALRTYLISRGLQFDYTGFDISPEMTRAAAIEHESGSSCRFINDLSDASKADYVVASGLFNVRLAANDTEWESYTYSTLDRCMSLASKACAFNMLTAYSDPEFMRDYLHYADPGLIFDVCKRRFSPHVSLLHDYPLYEFTVVVRLEDSTC